MVKEISREQLVDKIEDAIEQYCWHSNSGNGDGYDREMWRMDDGIREKINNLLSIIFPKRQ
jgi:hypothetical protein